LIPEIRRIAVSSKYQPEPHATFCCEGLAFIVGVLPELLVSGPSRKIWLPFKGA
jgi:hypothetical protein